MHAARAIAVLSLLGASTMPAVAFDCAEASYHLEVCGEGKRDGDNDGIPCENVCGKTLDEYRQRRGPVPPQMPPS